MENQKARPIGIFDSGIGGLTVLREIMKRSGNENLVYFGDTARLPYGTKSKETIIRFSRQIAEFLMQKEVKLIVAACNTASALALETLQKSFPVEVLGVIDPGAREVVRRTKNKIVGVIGTRSTIHSQVYQQRITGLDPAIKVYAKACPLFVPVIEEGLIDHDITDQLIAYYLEELKQTGIDTLILGCTHYPILKAGIDRYFSGNVTIIDSASVMADEVDRRLSEIGIKNPAVTEGSRHFYLSDQSPYLQNLAANLLGFYPEPTYYTFDQ